PPTQLPTTLIILSPFFFTDTPTTEIYTLSLRRSSDLLRQTFGRCPFRRREPNPPPIGTGRSPGIVEQGFSLPVKLQRELHLARSSGSAADGSGRAGNARWSESDQIGRIGIGAAQEVEDLRAEFEPAAFSKRNLFQHRKIPGRHRTHYRAEAEEKRKAWGLGNRRNDLARGNHSTFPVLAVG